MRILGIDSGMASSGAVLVEGGTITKCWSHSTKAWKKQRKHQAPSQVEVFTRSAEIAAAMLESVREANPDRIALEGYKDRGAEYKSRRAYQGTAPIALGILWQMLQAEFADILVVQDPDEALNPYDTIKKMWERGYRDLEPGDALLTNKETRDAAIHALHLGRKLRFEEASQ